MFVKERTDWLIILEGMPVERLSQFTEKINNFIQDKNLPNWLDGNKNLSTRGQGSLQYDLLPYVSDLNDVYKEISNRVFLELINQGRVTRLSRLHVESTWTVLGYENGFHRIHKHNTNRDIASVLYMRTSQNSFNKPGTFYAVVNGTIEEISPKPGDLLIFPVDILHGTYPQGPGVRQTLNIDFKVISNEQ